MTGNFVFDGGDFRVLKGVSFNGAQSADFFVLPAQFFEIRIIFRRRFFRLFLPDTRVGQTIFVYRSGVVGDRFGAAFVRPVEKFSADWKSARQVLAIRFLPLIETVGGVVLKSSESTFRAFQTPAPDFVPSLRRISKVPLIFPPSILPANLARG